MHRHMFCFKRRDAITRKGMVIMKKINRRNFLKVMGLASASLTLAACGGSSSTATSTAANTATSAAASAAAGDAAAAASDPAVSFSVTNTHSGEGVQDKSMDKLIELADKYSGGSIKGTKIAGGSLGGEREETEMLQLGTLECAFVADMGVDSAIGGLGWAWLPFMLTDYDQVDEYYINGWINDELTKQYADNGLIRVAPTENCFRECGNVKRPINSMADMTGLKIRVPETQACQDFYTALGAIPAAIATSETLAALEQGTVDGVDNSIYNMKSMGVLEKIKYITMLNYMYSGASITCSEEFWNSMTANQQAAFKQAADEAGAFFRENMRADEQTILDQGSFEVEEIDPSSDFYKQMKEKAVELWAGYASEYPSDIMDRINQDFSV